jgi:hypothetical protein
LIICLKYPIGWSRKQTDDDDHDRHEEQCAKSHPDYFSTLFVSIHFRQHIAKNITEGKQQFSSVKCEWSKIQKFGRGDIGDHEDCYEEHGDECCVFIILLWFHKKNE